MTTKYTPNFGLALPDFRMGPWHDLINNDLIKLDALMYGAMSQANVEPWVNDTAYAAGTSVLDSTDASVWLCVVDHQSAGAPITFAQDRVANPTYWTRLLTGFAPRGEWQQATNYFPYDLAYDSGRGIMALCVTEHTSTPIGSIVDDAIYWAFLLDMSGAGTVIAAAVSYSNTVTHIPSANVQDAIDYLESQIVSLDDVNIDQGNELADIRANIIDLQSQITALTATVNGVNTTSMKLVGNQTTTGGFRVTPFNNGNFAGTFIPDPLKGNYQYGSNTGAFNLQIPANDCAIDILVFNSATAGAITFVGFVIGTSTGDVITTTTGHKFIISIRRINNTTTYVVKALQ